MKLMFCGICGDVVSPGLTNRQPRWCHCGRHAVWWEDSQRGILSLHDSNDPYRTVADFGAFAWVIGLHNGILIHGGLCSSKEFPVENRNGVTTKGNLLTRKEWVQELLDETPNTYLFKRANSLVIRIAPGWIFDTGWAPLP